MGDGYTRCSTPITKSSIKAKWPQEEWAAVQPQLVQRWVPVPVPLNRYLSQSVFGALFRCTTEERIPCGQAQAVPAVDRR